MQTQKYINMNVVICMAIKIPKSQKIWLKIKTTLGDKKEKYVITSNDDRTKYFIYELTKEGYIKLGQSDNPLKLEDKYVKYNEVKEI